METRESQPGTETEQTQQQSEQPSAEAAEAKEAQARETGLARARTRPALAVRGPEATLPSLLGGPLLGFGPFSLMRRMMEDMDRVLQAFGMGQSVSEAEGLSVPLWSPQVEVFRRGDELVVRADLPGIDEGDVTVDVEDDTLIIDGERRVEREETEGAYRRSEIRVGRFHREIPLPEGIDADSARATTHNGVLEVSMRLPEGRQRGRRIPLEHGGEEQRPAPSSTEGKPEGESVH